MNKVINVNNISKVYKLYDKPVDRLKEALHPFKKQYNKEFYALRDVSFDVKKGETVGIIGKNGSGKSTLLKIITGVINPSQGEIEVNGRISALLELGAGFNPEYTGIENIYLNGTIMGYSRKEIDAKMNDIIEFADIGDYIYQPVKYYSSGMFVRVAFAVAINVDPEVLIVDEALSVGDIRFQQKCFRKIEEFKKNKTVLLVSHDMGAIHKYCDRVIWLDQGTLMEEGTSAEISKKYRAYMMDSKLYKYAEEKKSDSEENSQIALDLVNDSLDVSGDNRAKITGVGIFDAETNEKAEVVQAGTKVKLVLKTKMIEKIDDIIIGFTIKDRLGNIVTQTNNFILDQSIENNSNKDEILVSFSFVIPNLRRGTYTISPAIASGTQENHVQHSWVHDAVIIEVINNEYYDLEGFMFLDKVEFNVLSDS